MGSMMGFWPLSSRRRNAALAEEKKYAEMQHKIDDLRAMVTLLESNFKEIENRRKKDVV
jgi:hypothetical protein